METCQQSRSQTPSAAVISDLFPIRSEPTQGTLQALGRQTIMPRTPHRSTANTGHNTNLANRRVDFTRQPCLASPNRPATWPPLSEQPCSFIRTSVRHLTGGNAFGRHWSPHWRAPHIPTTVALIADHRQSAYRPNSTRHQAPADPAYIRRPQRTATGDPSTTSAEYGSFRLAAKDSP